MFERIKKVLDIVTTVTLLVCAAVLIGKLVFEIVTMAKLKYPNECVIINGEYYCREVKKTVIQIEPNESGIEM